MSAPATRRRILDSALSCFLLQGFEGTTIARIRERSGVSNGALFHHFRSKDAIADALYVDGIASFQHGLWELVATQPASLQAAVRGAIDHQLRWTETHPDLARFVYLRGHLDWDSPAGSELATLNRDLAAAFRSWLRQLVDRDQIRTSSMLMISAIVGGPAHAVARRWLAGQIDRPLSSFVDELADAACSGLVGKPADGPATLRPSAQLGRITLELVGEDGAVLASGRASAKLTPV